ncbi:dihydrofolate reductase [Nitratireductor mangrovi]|uniref:Dihydrofolate reductase n=1 Tax=Nitratireductor mangrovi TaxID=2599600 RepID=A0A5B8KUH9_9HYPH|nr:dihydrofolate reductase [Nitratireductor mangrovi]QDY99254.1 dihydrofolate reductase [Nitratireductor mangrovi]
MRVVLVVAIAENGIIGREGGLPWRLSTDLKRFKAETMGKPVIMGRKTFDSIGKPLPGRANIVITRDQDWRAGGVERAGSLDEALAIAQERLERPDGEACVIGGGEIYALAFERADRLSVTHVLAEIDGDTRFPPIDRERWRIVAQNDYPAGEKDSHATRHIVYERRC